MYHDESPAGMCASIYCRRMPSLPGPVLADGSFSTLDGPVLCLQGFVNVTCFIS